MDPEKKHVPVRQGEDLEKQKGRLPPGGEVTRSVYVLPFENGLFFKPAEVQSRTKFLNGVICVLSDRSGREEAERSRRSEPSKLSGAQERSDKAERSHSQERSDKVERSANAASDNIQRPSQLTSCPVPRLLRNFRNRTE